MYICFILQYSNLIFPDVFCHNILREPFLPVHFISSLHCSLYFHGEFIITMLTLSMKLLAYSETVVKNSQNIYFISALN